MSNIVCIAWTWISTAVCVVWDVVTTVVNAVLVTIESILGWVLSAVGFIIELILAIPVLGALIRWVLNGITHIVSIVVGIGDGILGALGIRPEKKLRVCTVILRDETGKAVATTPFVVALLQVAVDVYKRDANIRIIPAGPFKYATGFAGAEKVDSRWVTRDTGNSGAALLDAPCGGGGDWLETGAGFQLKSGTLCLFASWRRVVGYGAPITCFIVRSIPGPMPSSGCALWITDYATVVGETTLPPSSPRTLGHELGHACGLIHACVDDDNKNMMATADGCSPATTSTGSDRVNPRMTDQQAIWVRMSKHVTYF
ncbi:MAG: hypothetical protein GY719_41725 [bacterium]|nr:hypothetical protein [bacterium]